MEVWKCVKTTWRLLLLKRTLASGSMEMYEDYLLLLERTLASGSMEMCEDYLEVLLYGECGSMEMCEDYLEAASLEEDTCKWKYGNV